MSEDKRVKTEGLDVVEHTAKNNNYNELASVGNKSADFDEEILWVSPYERLQHWVDAKTVVSFRNGQFQCNSKSLNNRLTESNKMHVAVYQNELPDWLRDKVRERYSPEFIREELDEGEQIDI